MGGDPYRNFAQEYGKKFGKEPIANRTHFKQKVQTDRATIVKYLLESNAMSNNPKAPSELLKFGIYSDSLNLALSDISPLSPVVVGVVGVVRAGDSYRNITKSSRIYLPDVRRAKDYLDMMKKLKRLP